MADGLQINPDKELKFRRASVFPLDRRSNESRLWTRRRLLVLCPPVGGGKMNKRRRVTRPLRTRPRPRRCSWPGC